LLDRVDALVAAAPAMAAFVLAGGEGFAPWP
jgi:CDP-diglyceride synthetase